MATIMYLDQPDQHQAELLVMLPGINNSPTAFSAAGMVNATRAVASVDLLAVDASFKYYMDRSVVQRLHDEVIVPARNRGYKRIWLLGTSMGGFGCLLYLQQYPDDIAGVVLLAPFLGEGTMQTELQAAGGLANWQYQAGSGKDEQDRKVREIWHLLQDSFLPTPSPLGTKIWLAWGDKDKFRPDAIQLASIMPPSKTLTAPGTHDWKTWATLFGQLLSKLGLPKQ